MLTFHSHLHHTHRRRHIFKIIQNFLERWGLTQSKWSWHSSSFSLFSLLSLYTVALILGQRWNLELHWTGAKGKWRLIEQPSALTGSLLLPVPQLPFSVASGLNFSGPVGNFNGKTEPHPGCQSNKPNPMKSGTFLTSNSQVRSLNCGLFI